MTEYSTIFYVIINNEYIYYYVLIIRLKVKMKKRATTMTVKPMYRGLHG